MSFPLINRIVTASFTGLTAGADNTGLTVAHGLPYTPKIAIPIVTSATPAQVSVTAKDATNVTLTIRTNAGQTAVDLELLVG